MTFIAVVNAVVVDENDELIRFRGYFCTNTPLSASLGTSSRGMKPSRNERKEPATISMSLTNIKHKTGRSRL